MPGIALSQAVDHADHFGQELSASSFSVISAQLLDRSTGSLLIETVVDAALSFLAHTFFADLWFAIYLDFSFN